MKHQFQSFTRIGRQFQSLKRQVYAVRTSVSFPVCQRSCLIWQIMTNTMTNTYVVIFLSASFFGRSYHSRYQNFEFTDCACTYPHSHHDVFNMDSVADFLVVANESHRITTLTLVIMRAGGVVHVRAVQFLQINNNIELVGF